jgi:hypothetical protein
VFAPNLMDRQDFTAPIRHRGMPAISREPLQSNQDAPYRQTAPVVGSK